MKGYDNSCSEQIFRYLGKALELNPNYGDAKYFYGAQCSGNAFFAMQNYDLEQLKHFYNQAFHIGAYPEWLIEFGKNLLMSCDTNAILFTGGNADFAERPIYFSNFASPTFYGGLNEYFQNCGLVSKLVPIPTKESIYSFDKSKIETMVRSESLVSYKTIKEKNMPRISGIVMSGYSGAFLHLAGLYKESNEKDQLKSLIKLYEDKMKIDFDSEYETLIIDELNR